MPYLCFAWPYHPAQYRCGVGAAWSYPVSTLAVLPGLLPGCGPLCRHSEDHRCPLLPLTAASSLSWLWGPSPICRRLTFRPQVRAVRFLLAVFKQPYEHEQGLYHEKYSCYICLQVTTQCSQQASQEDESSKSCYDFLMPQDIQVNDEDLGDPECQSVAATSLGCQD